MRPSAIHASVDEWNKIATELLRRGVVTVIDRAELPLVGGRPVLVEAFGVGQTGPDPACDASPPAHQECGYEQYSTHKPHLSC